MPTVNALHAYDPPPTSPFTSFERRRSTTSSLSNNTESVTSPPMRTSSGMSPPVSSRNKPNPRPRSAKFSSYRLRSNSGLSLHTNEDILRQYTDYYPDGTPRAVYGNGGQWSSERLRSIDSITSSKRSSMAFTNSDSSSDLPIPGFLGRDMFDMVINDPTASNQLWKFAQSRGVGQNVDYLMKIRDYIQSLEQVVIQLSTISTSYTSITATSPINLPSHMSKTLNTNIKHLTTSLIPSLENMFIESKAYVEQRIIREIFPEFVKQQLSLCTSLVLSLDVEGDSPPSPYPGLRGSFCLSDATKNGSPIVYASDEFQDLTGYARDETITHNCRFLQGPQTDRETISRLRSAIWRADECNELILNYKRDGSSFWNLLSLCPLKDASGNLRFYLGAQIDVSSSIESHDDVLKMLSYGANEDDKTADRTSSRFEGSQGDAESEESMSRPHIQLKSPKKSFFKSFKKMPPPPLSPPSSPRRSCDRPRSSAGIGLEKTYSTRTVLRRLSTRPGPALVTHSRYMVLEHVPSYPSSLGSMPVDQKMKYPPKLSIAFFSPAMVEALDINLPPETLYGKDVFDVLAEQATLPSVTKAFRTTVREVVVRDGKSVSLDLAFANHIPRRANITRVMSGESSETMGREKKGAKMMSHWTPLKDGEGHIKFVVLVVSPL